jgi:hypothetical protein
MTGLHMALIQEQRPLVNSAHHDSSSPSFENLCQALAEAVSFSRASGQPVQILITMSLHGTTRSSLAKDCNAIVTALQVAGEKISEDVQEVDGTEKVCIVTIKADLID